MDHKPRDSNSELMIQPENTEKQKLSDDQLSHEFRRAPFLLYRFWLVVNFPFVLLEEYGLIWFWFSDIFGGRMSSYRIDTIIGLIFFLIGCCQMLHAISQRKPKIAQAGFVKLQYALISSMVGCIIQFDGMGGDFGEKDRWLMFTQVIHVVGGFAVLRVFKKNHSEERLIDGSQDEISKYDKQLSRWPYFAYQCLLKFSFIFELISVFRVALPILPRMWQATPTEKERYNIDLLLVLLFVQWGISSFMNACSCFQIEVATRTRDLAKSKRAIVLLKICLALSLIKCLFIRRCIEFDSTLREETTLLWCFGYSVLVPVISFIGALKVNKILEQKENSSIDL